METGGHRNFLMLLSAATAILIILCTLPARSQPTTSPASVKGAKVVQGTTKARTGNPLRLAGTTTCPDPECSLAVIMDEKTRQQKLVHEGDLIGTIRIKKIHENLIVIDSGNGDKTIRVGHVLTRRTPLPATGTAPKKTAAKPVERSHQRSYVIKENRLNAVIQEQGKPADTMIAYESNLLNQRKGLKIAAIPTGSIFREIGLRPGDLLLRFNDKEIARPEDILTFIRAILRDRDADLTIRRRARTYHFKLKLQ